MASVVAERHIRALLLGRECADLGARPRTISLITGLSHKFVVGFFFDEEEMPRRGRPPGSAYWFDRSNLVDRVEASMLVALFARIRELGFDAPDALISAFKQYREKCGGPERISFDRAFDLVCTTFGLWGIRTPQLALGNCSECDLRFLCPPGAAAQSECHFCKLIRRHRFDKRIQERFPARLLPQVPPL